MGHPPGAVSLPSPAYVDLAPAVASISAWWGATPDELVGVLRRDGPPGPDQLAAIVWVLTPDRDQLLLVDHRHYGWSCPGGHVEHGESPAAAAARELAEESGLHLTPIDAEPVTLTLVPALRRTPSARRTGTGCWATASSPTPTPRWCPNGIPWPGTRPSRFPPTSSPTSRHCGRPFASSLFPLAEHGTMRA